MYSLIIKACLFSSYNHVISIYVLLQKLSNFFRVMFRRSVFQFRVKREMVFRISTLRFSILYIIYYHNSAPKISCGYPYETLHRGTFKIGH